MGRIYSVDQYRDNRRVRPEMVLIVLVAIIALVAGIYIYLDLRRNDTTIDESNNNPVLGEIASEEDSYKRIETDNYVMQIPQNWTRADPPEIIVNGTRYYPDRYEGTAGDNIGRRIDIYHRAVPGDLPVAKVLEVQVEGSMVFPREISPQCITFTDTGDANPAGEPYPSKWNNISFTCKTSSVSNEVMALQTKSAEGLNFNVNGQDRRMTIVYMDHGSSIDNDIFFEILRSFRAK